MVWTKESDICMVDNLGPDRLKRMLDFRFWGF